MGRTLRAPSSRARRAGRGHRLGGAGHHHLARGVVVGHPDVALGPLAGGLGVVVGDPEQGGHRAGGVLAGPGHGLAPGHHQADPVLEGQGAAGHQGGVLAQAVAGAGRRGQAQPLDGVEHHQAEHEGGQLGVAVLVSSSMGASSSRCARSRPAAAEASPTTSHEGWSTQASPMPDRWEPCPGKVNTNTPLSRTGARGAPPGAAGLSGPPGQCRQGLAGAHGRGPPAGPPGRRPVATGPAMGPSALSALRGPGHHASRGGPPEGIRLGPRA